MADQTFAVHCGFFDAINSDRTYSADEMNRPYKRVISNGVFATPNGTPSTDLQVTASSGMSIICKKGEGLFGDKWFENPSGIAITVPSNTGTVPRIDSVIVQVDTRTSGRVGNIVHRTGTPASSPVPPAINQVEGVIEYRLANIRVNAGVSAITQSMITDRRGSSDCPWVTSLIYQVDTSTLYDQWQAAYAEYFEEEKAIWDAWYSQLTEDLDVSMTLDRHTNTVTTTAQTTGTIPIGLAYNHNTDILEVYINGLRAVEGTHYIVVDDTSILVENQLQIGQTVTFVVMRSVISGSATNIMVLLQELESQIAGIAGGTPTVVDAKADMTEHDKIYILSTDGKWYYYSATQEDWMIGGTYGGVPTDPTLTQAGKAADAKAVGDALASKADSSDVTALGTRVTAVDGEIDALKDFNAVQLIPDHADVQSKTETGLTWSCLNGVFTINGTTTSSWFENIYNSRYSIPDWFAEGNKLFIKLNKSGSDVRYIYFRIYAYKQDGTTELVVETYNDTVFTVPNIDDAVGIYARLFILSGNVVSGSIHPVVSNAPSNLELSDSIESTDTSVNTLQNTFESTDAKDTVDLVPRLSNGDTVKNGVTFSYLNGTTTINGTATSAAYFKLCGDTNSLPDGVIAGRRYFIDIAHNGGTTARVRVECKVDGTTSYIYDGDKSTPLLIPSGATGLAIYIYVYSTGIVENESITVSFRRALTNFALSNSILPPNPGAMMTIIDDDGALGFYTQLLPIIRTKHIPIASAIVGSKIGVNPAYMTWEQVEECFADGAEILNHTYMHYGETDETRPTNEIRMDYTKNANLMWAHNIPTGDILVYPGGSGNLITAQVAAKRFASAAFRANGNKLNLINQINPFYIDRYRIESDYSYDIDQMKGLIDNCIAKGGWMVWMIHTSSGYNWNESALSAVSQSIDYAISSGLPIVTARYGIERYIKKRLY